ncbi:hypothetical protein ACLOEZ_10540 [Levilactobacillus brevis]|uniref:hypothetical protein n=1 Tax=Levilactobacillus brevis TaxID=1580 RepID=UPI003EB9EF7C
MKFSITDSKNKTFNLPINPKEFNIDAATDDKTVSVVKLGQINLIGDEKLKSIEIASTLPVKTADVHYLSTEAVYKNGQTYLDKLNKLYKAKKPIRLVISGTKVTFKGIISEFKYGMADGFADEYAYTLKIGEYKTHKAKKVKAKKKSKKVAKKGKSRSKPPKKIGRGSKVTVNGRLHRDSVGNGPGATERNATRKISLVAPKAKYPYHVATLSGGARGWVSKSAVKAV